MAPESGPTRRELHTRMDEFDFIFRTVALLGIAISTNHMYSTVQDLAFATPTFQTRGKLLWTSTRLPGPLEVIPMESPMESKAVRILLECESDRGATHLFGAGGARRI